MTGNSTRHRGGGVRAVQIVAGNWSSGPLVVARTERHRRHGLSPVPGPFGMVFRTRSLIGWGMREPINWFALSVNGVIASTGRLAPHRFVVAPRTVRWMVEIPEWIERPPIGVAAIVIPILTAWPDD